MFTFHGEYRRANNERVSCAGAERSRRAATRTNSTKTSIDPSARGKFLSFRALFPYGQLLGIKFALRDERGQPIWEGNDISFFFRLISRRKESEKCGTNLLKVEEISGGSIEFPLKIFRI